MQSPETIPRESIKRNAATVKPGQVNVGARTRKKDCVGWHGWANDSQHQLEKKDIPRVVAFTSFG